MRAELRGGPRAKLLRGGAVRAASQVTAGRGGAGCGLFLWQHLRCGLTAGQVTAGRAAGYDVAKFAVRAVCGPSYCGAGRAAGSDFQPAQGLSV